MSVKEKVQQIIQQAELEQAAKLRRQEEGRLQWLAECQEKTRQQEALETTRLEKGKKVLGKVLEATGVQRVLRDVFDVLKEIDPGVELHIRRGSLSRYSYGMKHPKYRESGKFRPDELPREESSVGTIGIFVEAVRGEGETTTQLGVELEIDNPRKIWITTASSNHGGSTLGEKEDLFMTTDNRLLPKLEEKFAQHIVEGHHRHYNPVWDPLDQPLPPP